MGGGSPVQCTLLGSCVCPAFVMLRSEPHVLSLLDQAKYSKYTLSQHRIRIRILNLKLDPCPQPSHQYCGT